MEAAEQLAEISRRTFEIDILPQNQTKGLA
jgi:hypothetical protein